MKKPNKKLIGSLIAVCLVLSVFTSAFTFARYAKNMEVAVLNLTVVPSSDIKAEVQTEPAEETTATAPTEAPPAETQAPAPTEETAGERPTEAAPSEPRAEQPTEEAATAPDNLPAETDR